MLQSASWDKKSYQGPIHMLYSAIRHNSKKFLKLYDPRICWVPTVVNALGPVLHYLSGMIISKLFRLNSRTDGILYYLARAGFLALESVILSPLHLIKKRLEIQTVMKYHPNEIDEHEQRHQPGADSGKSLDLFDFHPSVFIYPERYTGIIDCLAKTISLEGNGVPSIPDPQTIPLRYSADRQKNISKILQHSNLSREPFERKFQDYISISGVKSMFRGFWCLYLNKIILFSLEEINRKPDVLPWHNI